MSIDDVKMTNTESIGATINQADMNIRIISALHVASYILIIIGLIVGIIYMIKSRKRTTHKIILGIAIILVPIIINVVLGIVKSNIILSSTKTLNQTQNLSTNTVVTNVANNSSKLWISNYKKFSNQKTTYNLNLFGNKQTIGITVPIDINKLNEYTATYIYYPYGSVETVKTSNLKDINNIAVSTVYVRDSNNSLLFMIELNGQGLTFRECIEQGKFIIRAQGDLLEGSMNISASQLGINIQNENFDDQSNILDTIINTCGGPTYIVSDKSIEELNKEKVPSIHYKLVYQYDKYVVAFYVQEDIDDNIRNCEIRYVYYYPIESFNNNILTDNNYYNCRLR